MADSKISDNRIIEYPEVYIRKSDLDDTEAISNLIEEEAHDNLNLLYDYPSIVTLL